MSIIGKCPLTCAQANRVRIALYNTAYICNMCSLWIARFSSLSNDCSHSISCFLSSFLCLNNYSSVIDGSSHFLLFSFFSFFLFFFCAMLFKVSFQLIIPLCMYSYSVFSKAARPIYFRGPNMT